MALCALQADGFAYATSAPELTASATDRACSNRTRAVHNESGVPTMPDDRQQHRGRYVLETHSPGSRTSSSSAPPSTNALRARGPIYGVSSMMSASAPPDVGRPALRQAPNPPTTSDTSPKPDARSTLAAIIDR